jgi:hypothetical protein
VQSQLTASATTAGALISTERFLVPEFQREYAWQKDEYIEFWDDLHASLGDESYFLGLVILTAGEDRMQVVDGQQRLLTITLLAAALRHEAIRHRRRGLADQIESTFLKVLDYDSDDYVERISLSDPSDNSTLQRIVSSDADLSDPQPPGVGISARLLDAYSYLLRKVQEDLAAALTSPPSIDTEHRRSQGRQARTWVLGSQRAEKFQGELTKLLPGLLQHPPTLRGRAVAAPRSPGHYLGPGPEQPFGLHLVQGGIQRSGADPVPVACQFFGHPRAVHFASRGVVKHV